MLQPFSTGEEVPPTSKARLDDQGLRAVARTVGIVLSFAESVPLIFGSAGRCGPSSVALKSTNCYRASANLS